MKKVGDLMAELGFNKNAPDSVKEAFIKNLIRSAYGVEVQTPTEVQAKGPSLELPQLSTTREPERVGVGEQLSFDFTKASA